MIITIMIIIIIIWHSEAPSLHEAAAAAMAPQGRAPVAVVLRQVSSALPPGAVCYAGSRVYIYIYIYIHT